MRIAVDAEKFRHVVQQAGRHHQPAALHDLLSGLENDFDRSGQFILLFLQDGRRAEHAGGVEIMAAGMHDPVLQGGVGQAAFLADGQGVDIAAQADHAARLRAADHGDDAGRHAGLRQFDPHPRQRFAQLFRRPEFPQAQLRMAVEVPEKRRQFPFRHCPRPRSFPLYIAPEIIRESIQRIVYEVNRFCGFALYLFRLRVSKAPLRAAGLGLQRAVRWK